MVSLSNQTGEPLRAAFDRLRLTPHALCHWLLVEARAWAIGTYTYQIAKPSSLTANSFKWTFEEKTNLHENITI